MEPLCGTDCRAFLSYLANHRSSLRACVTRNAGRALRAYFARQCGHFGTPGRYRFLLPDRPKKQLSTREREPMNTLASISTHVPTIQRFTTDAAARGVWTIISEPGDRDTGTLIAALGAEEALNVLLHGTGDAAGLDLATLRARTRPAPQRAT